MKPEKQARIPKQQRSREKAALIKRTALNLFSEKGYFQTTTNEIAKQAGLSIGTLYAYYRNKLDLYEELVRDHYTQVSEKAGLAHVPEDAPAHETMYLLIKTVWNSHSIHTAFQKEMAALSAQSEKFRAIEQKYRVSMAPVIVTFLDGHREFFRVTDYPAAAFLISSSLEAVIHEAVFYTAGFDRDIIIRELADMFCRYLVKPEYMNE